MAKPDTDDGWIKMAHELGAALAFADFSKGARIVLNEMFSQIFGPVKQRSAVLSPTKIAGDTGQFKSHVSRAVRELVDSGVIRRLNDGTYVFIKDYEVWTVASGRGDTSKTPRLTRAEMVSCANAPARAIATKNVTQPGNPSISVVTQPGNDLLPNRVTKVTQPGNASDSPPVPPLVNGCAEFEKGEVKESPPLSPLGGGTGERADRDPPPQRMSERERKKRAEDAMWDRIAEEIRNGTDEGLAE